MDINIILPKNEDGVQIQPPMDTPSAGEGEKPITEGAVKKKRRRGKSKRKVMKPFLKVPWQNRRRNEKSKRNNGYRKIILRKTHAPYNNNQFLMEIHKPEPENNFEILQTPSARTRDSSFSVDSEDNYFYSLPADEEEFLTKEFSSVYEDAQCERLANMSKNELIQEYLMLESKYEKLLVKCNEEKSNNEDKDTTGTENEIATDKDSMSTDQDTTGTSIDLNMNDELKLQDIVQRVKEQEEEISKLKLENDKLRCENAHLRKQSYHSSSADSESDSSSTSVSNSSCSSRSLSPVTIQQQTEQHEEVLQNGVNGIEVTENGLDDSLN